MKVMIGLLGGPEEKVKTRGDLLGDEMECPLATQDEIINKGNKQKAILTAAYGPATDKKKCGNCEYYDNSKEMMKCGVGKGMGYCTIFEFTCADKNVCNAWGDMEEDYEEADSEGE
jgi:hypothetical protein